MGRCADSVTTGATRGPRAADGAGERAYHLGGAPQHRPWAARFTGLASLWPSRAPGSALPRGFASVLQPLAAAPDAPMADQSGGSTYFLYASMNRSALSPLPELCPIVPAPSPRRRAPNSKRSTISFRTHPTESPLVTLSLRRTYLVPRRWRRACYLLRRQVGRGGGRGPPFITA